MIRPVELKKPEISPDLIADLPRDIATLTKPRKTSRWILRLLIYGSLGFGLIVFLALPSFRGCGNKAKSSEGRTFVGAMNRGQQAFWVENNTFGKSLPALELGINKETSNYKYELQSFNLVSYQYAISKNDQAKSFVGAVFVLPESSLNIQTKNKTQLVKQQLATFTIVCESPKVGVKIKLPKPFLSNGKPTCAEGTNFIQ